MKEARKYSSTLDEVDSVDKVEVESATKSLSTSTRFKGIRLSFMQTLENILKKALENGTEKDEDNNCSRGSQYSNSMRYSFSSVSKERDHSNQSVKNSHPNANCINNCDSLLDDTHTKTMKRACCTLS